MFSTSTSPSVGSATSVSTMANCAREGTPCGRSSRCTSLLRIDCPPRQAQIILDGRLFSPISPPHVHEGTNMISNGRVIGMGSCTAAALFALALTSPSIAQVAPGAGASKHYFLPATEDNVQWGWYDTAEKPKLTVHSGDTVSIETLSHSLGQIKPGVGMDEVMKLRRQNDGGGPHSITGPISVAEAEPGDTLEIRFLKIVPKPDAFNFNLPGKEFPAVGLLPAEFPDGFLRFYKLNLAKMQTVFKPGIVIDLQPFPG